MSNLTENEIFLLLQKVESVCRLCFSSLEKSQKLYSIFENSIQKILQYCMWTQLKFNEDDSLPKLICLNCYTALKTTCNFLEIVIKSEDIVNKFIEQKEILTGKKNNSSEIDDDEVPLFETLDDIEDDSLKEYSGKTRRNKSSPCAKLKPKKIGKEKRIKSKKCCGVQFTTKTKYNIHVRSHGLVRKSYECSECNKKYVSHFELKVHLRKHTGEKPFSCSICEKSFIDKRNLKRHEKIHTGNKNHKCSVCDKKFLHLFTLKTHERTHSGEKPFVCENCGKSFNTSTELKIHNRTHTKEKPYLCNNCEKAFSSKAALNTHILVHTGEKKYSCTLCPRKCRTSFDLKTHMRCHSNERPYFCKYGNCEKRYKNSSQLNVHLRTHKGEKPHQCMLCFKQFGESNTLRRHMGIHEKNIENNT